MKDRLCANCNRESEYDCCSEVCFQRYRDLCALRKRMGDLESLCRRLARFLPADLWDASERRLLEATQGEYMRLIMEPPR